MTTNDDIKKVEVESIEEAFELMEKGIKNIAIPADVMIHHNMDMIYLLHRKVKNLTWMVFSLAICIILTNVAEVLI